MREFTGFCVLGQCERTVECGFVGVKKTLASPKHPQQKLSGFYCEDAITQKCQVLGRDCQIRLAAIEFGNAGHAEEYI